MDELSFARLDQDEEYRRKLFPVCREKIFLAHAGVTALPGPVADAVIDYTRAASVDQQEFGDVLKRIDSVRVDAARLLGADASEIALLGPTSLGLSLFAHGLPWQTGDEVVYYPEDYPANVYPWMELERRGVQPVALHPDQPGAITPDLVERALTPKTRMVALASAHFFSGCRIDIEAIGKLLRERGIFFSLDAIQTLGAFPTTVEQVDFLSADSHKWLLGPLTAGIVYVRKELQETLRPVLLGAWNVRSPDFLAQDEIRFMPGGQRYEPGVLNTSGLFGMQAALRMILHLGVEAIAERLLGLKQTLVHGLREMNFTILGPVEGPEASSITTCRPPHGSAESLFQRLEAEGITASLRHDHQRNSYLRFSPHFYNTEEEMQTVLRVLRESLKK